MRSTTIIIKFDK